MSESTERLRVMTWNLWWRFGSWRETARAYVSGDALLPLAGRDHRALPESSGLGATVDWFIELEAAWFDRERCPFTSHYLGLPEGRLHDVDEGSGPAVVLVHGTPGWSHQRHG